MEIKRITVSSLRKIPHPEQEFAMLSTLASLEAEVAPGEDVRVAMGKLQNMADAHVDQHMDKLVARIWMSKSGAKAKKATENKSAALIAKHAEDF